MAEKAKGQKPQHTSKRAKPRIRTADAVLGVLLLALSVCGMLGIWHQGSVLAGRLKDPAARTEAVTRCLLPFALAETPAFTSPEELSDPDFLTLAAWSMICGGRLSGYPETDGMRIVPEADLTAAGNTLLGTARQPEYKTIGFTDEIRFYYDEPKKSWILPEAPQWFGSQPVIRAMRPENGGYTVEADYMPELPAWSEQEPEITASATFTVSEQDGTWQVTSLQFAGEADSEAETEASGTTAE